MRIWRGRVFWQRYIHPHPHPHTQLKKSGIPHIHTHIQSMRRFPVKTGTDSDNTHGNRFICHLYIYIAYNYLKLIKLIWGARNKLFSLISSVKSKIHILYNYDSSVIAECLRVYLVVNNIYLFANNFISDVNKNSMKIIRFIKIKIIWKNGHIFFSLFSSFTCTYFRIMYVPFLNCNFDPCSLQNS